MSSRFLEELKTAYRFEEKVFESISYVLNLLLTQISLPQEHLNKIRSILDTLTQDTLRHEETLLEIIKEMERFNE